MIFQWVGKHRRDPFTHPAGKCVDVFDSHLLRRAVDPSFAHRRAGKRGPKRVHFVERVTFAAPVLRNMLYRGGCGNRWHMGCNYLVTRTTTSLGSQKKRRHGFAQADTGYGKKNAKRSASDQKEPRISGVFFTCQSSTCMILLDLMGDVALLLWGLHMVRSGIVRAFGSDLRRFLGLALRNRFLAFLAGIGVTALLQSSTATGLMTASFVTGGAVELVPALAMMLGANVGTTLIVQVLSFNVSAVAPLLFLVGVTAFKRGGTTRTRDLGRVAIGVGLMVLSLHILLDTLAPAENAPAVHALLQSMTDEPLLCLLIAAALTWAAHSSVTVVLLVMSLAYSNFITPVAALALVLGANLGSAINPLVEGSHSDNPASRRLPLGNLLNRAIGCGLVLPFLNPIAAAFMQLEPNPSHMAADFHTAFNLALAVVFILPLNGLATLLTRFLPDRPKPNDPSTPLYLDETALATPSVALACAARDGFPRTSAR